MNTLSYLISYASSEYERPQSVAVTVVPAFITAVAGGVCLVPSRGGGEVASHYCSKGSPEQYLLTHVCSQGFFYHCWRLLLYPFTKSVGNLLVLTVAVAACWWPPWLMYEHEFWLSLLCFCCSAWHGRLPRCFALLGIVDPFWCLA